MQHIGIYDLIVADDGKVWGAQSAELYEHHLATGGKFDLPSYLVRNCGHVRIFLPPNTGCIKLTFRAGTLSVRSVMAVAEIILTQASKQIVIERLGADPAFLVTQNPDDVIAILVDQAESTKRPKFFRDKLSLERLTEPQGQQMIFKKSLDAWSQSHGCLDLARQDDLSFLSKERHYVARMINAKPVFEEFGGGFSALRTTANQSQGCMVEDIPDRQYGSWVAECLLETASLKMPSLELIEATVTTDGCTKRLRYERLLLPWLSRGEIVVSALSVPRVVF